MVAKGRVKLLVLLADIDKGGDLANAAGKAPETGECILVHMLGSRSISTNGQALEPSIVNLLRAAIAPLPPD